MKNQLKTYIEKTNNLLAKSKLKNKNEVISEHITQIKIFQHERLIHLIVTTFVGIISILFFIVGVITQNIILLFLFILTLFLFIPYIFHYYYLENNTQKLYIQLSQLKEK